MEGWKGWEREARLEFERNNRETERAAEAVFQASQLDLQQQYITLLEAKAQSEKDRDDTKVIQLKKYDEALRNSVTKLGIEPKEIIVFFKILSGYIPKDLHVSLMKLYLNDRARALINCVAASYSADYECMKIFMLHEFRLVLQQLLEVFNTSVPQSNETFKAYITRLSMVY